MMSLVSTWIKTEYGLQVDERLCDRPHNKAVVLALFWLDRTITFPS